MLTEFAQKIPEFEEYIQRFDPDIIALQETFLQPCHSFNIPNYTIYRNDRLTHRGGGTAILIKNSIAHHSIHIHTHSLENTTIVLEGSNKITICCIYRPPNSPHQALIPDLLKILRNRTHCFIVGDYNAKHHSWSPHSNNNPCGSALFKFLKNCGFLLSSSAEPTTIPKRANHKPATIDFGISCGLDDVLVETQVELSSDHNPVQFILPTISDKPHAQNCTTFTNWNLFQDLLTTSIPGNPTINNSDEIEERISQFTNSIHLAINQSSKFKVFTHNITFIPLHVREKIKEKNRLRKLWQSTGYPPIKHEMNKLQKQIKRDLKLVKQKEWDDILDEANFDPPKLHKIIKKQKAQQITYPPLLGYRGMVYDTLDKANLFADTMEESFQENSEPYNDEFIEKVERKVRRFFRNISFSTPPLTSPEEVCNIILGLENRKAAGADQIKNIALKSLPINAITFLTKIFNKCLMYGYFPDAWKHAIITLLPKKGKDTKLAINYRPISLLSSIGKIYEKIILSRLKEHADNNNIIPSFQHGFRENTATNHQLLRLTNLVVSGFNNHETTGGAFLDVEKAFDRVWHDGLLLKLIELNFPPYIIMIINNFLRNRTFQIKISSTLSRTACASAGCPQGSLLSPLLYNIFTHDFPTAPTVHICLFADDAAIISQACSPDIVRINLQKYLKKLQVWLTKWRIKINVNKSQAIIFKRGNYRNRMQYLKLFRTNIPWTTNVEYLGVTLDYKLNFKNHLTKITCKFKKTLMILPHFLTRTLTSPAIAKDKSTCNTSNQF
ncbi:RNA-directed DNA polymerase from mobile element jockey [Trichonephila clavipes]|nr:RNA-directed DNA polymerase from mobile element jockey [Trichonephila clavipes]